MSDLPVHNKCKQKADQDDGAHIRRNSVVGFALSLILFLAAITGIVLSLAGRRHSHGLSIITVDSVDTNGPNIWIGIDQTCSRPDGESDLTCTRSAKDEVHIALVTDKIADVIHGINGQAIAIAFLVLSAIFTVIATIVLLMPVVRTRGRALRTGIDLCPHGMIIALGMLSILWSAIPAIVECSVVGKASKGWSEANAEQVGLEFHIGAIYCLTIAIPIIQFFALICAYRTIRIESYHDAKAEAFAEKEARRIANTPPSLPGKVEIVKRTAISPLWVETILDTGHRLENGKTVYWVSSPTSVHSCSSSPSSPASADFQLEGDISHIEFSARGSDVGCAI